MFVISTIIFVIFMYNTRLGILRPLLVSLAIAATSYTVSTKHITHPKGFNAVQAMVFYKACKKQEISKPEQCRKHMVKFKQTAERYSFSKTLSDSDLMELFEVGYKIANRKEK